MFTGIITDIGTIRSVKQRGDLRIEIATGYDVTSVDMGASIACDGVCLTVVEKTSDSFCVDVSAESAGLTNICEWKTDRPVNLERALKVGDELGGHIVSGHVDGVAEIVALRDEGDSTRVTLRAPDCTGQIYCPQGIGCIERHLVDRERSEWHRLRDQLYSAYQGCDHLGFCGSGRPREPWKSIPWRATLRACKIGVRA
jgi:riboflavin synthase alpha subunit